MSILLALLLLPLFTFYLSQTLFLAPNTGDGALILDYVRLTAQGQRTFWDFLDSYGPLSWILPAWAYRISGEKVIGISLLLMIIKLIILMLSYGLVLRLTNRWYAVMASTGMCLFLGLPWQYFQIPYSYLHTLPLTLLVSWLLLDPSHRWQPLRFIVAGLLTAAAVWLKVNIGFFLMAGGLWVCFFWIPLPLAFSLSPVSFSPSKAIHHLFFWIQIVAIWIGVSIFFKFIWPYFNKQYFLYLGLPLLVLGAITSLQMILENSFTNDSQKRRFWVRLKASLIYGSSTGIGVIGVFLYYFGWKAGFQYIRELSGILSRVDYHLPFPLIGMDGWYQNYSLYYFPQFLWLISLLAIGLMIAVLKQLSEGESFFHPTHLQNPLHLGLWAIITFHYFVIYSRSDETHIVQATIPAITLFTVVLYRWERLLMKAWQIRYGRFHLGTWLFRGISALLLGSWASMLWTPPTLKVFEPKSSPWNSPHLAYLPLTDPHRYLLAEVDVAINDASRYIDQRTPDGTEVFVISQSEMINFNSHTEPVGGRYRYLFYLLRTKLLHRQDFNELAPPDLLSKILANPPPIFVGNVGPMDLLDEFPEIKILLEKNYPSITRFGTILVYEKKPLCEGA